MPRLCLLAICLAACSGCHGGVGYTSSGSGATWGGTHDGNPSEVVIVVAYESSKHVDAIRVKAGANIGSDQFSRSAKSEWNSIFRPIGFEVCGGHENILKFPEQVKKVFIVNEDGTVIDLDSATMPTSVGHGLTVQKQSGACP